MRYRTAGPCGSLRSARVYCALESLPSPLRRPTLTADAFYSSCSSPCLHELTPTLSLNALNSRRNVTTGGPVGRPAMAKGRADRLPRSALHRRQRLEAVAVTTAEIDLGAILQTDS